jgi:hypothetical protein
MRQVIQCNEVLCVCCIYRYICYLVHVICYDQLVCKNKRGDVCYLD